MKNTGYSAAEYSAIYKVISLNGTGAQRLCRRKNWRAADRSELI